MSETLPITEADLHAYVDEQLPAARRREVEAYLADRPDEMQRVESYRAQKRELRALFDPVLDETLPQRVMHAARPRTPWTSQRLAAGIAIALISGAAGWTLRGEMPMPGAGAPPQGASSHAAASSFVMRAAVAHAVFSADQRRAVEIDAAHEDQLVAWLSKRMGAPMKPPHLQAVGYVLEGGRLLPGGQGPVAQFMYRDDKGSKLTLYVSNEISDIGSSPTRAGKANTGFRYAQEGQVKVFYWVDGPFGYAISADAERADLARVSTEVYRQLTAARE